MSSFYRTTGGAEIDLVLELPVKNGLWAIEVKRCLAPKVEKDFTLPVKISNPIAVLLSIRAANIIL